MNLATQPIIRHAAQPTRKHTFMGLVLTIDPSVLVPRSETELLGNVAIEALRQISGALRVVDMCCGSGNLTCAIATAVPQAHVWAADISHDSVNLARRNAQDHALQERVEVVQGDLFGSLPATLAGSIDMVVCNPPYMSSKRVDERHDLHLEPRQAFDGGPYGLTIHGRVATEATSFLKPGGTLLFEIGLGQHKQAQRILERAGAYDNLEFIRNDAGEVRVISAIRK